MSYHPPHKEQLAKVKQKRYSYVQTLNEEKCQKNEPTD